MPKIPQSVIARLSVGPAGASGTIGAQHPDANLLSAFSENSLDKRERAEVVEHLAQCPQCRDVLALQVAAASQVGEETSSAKSPKRGPEWRWLAKTELRWAAMAASLAVVAGIVLLHQPDRVNQPGTQSSSATTALQPPLQKSPDSASAGKKLEIAKQENSRGDVAEKETPREPRAASKTIAEPIPSATAANGSFDREILRNKDKVAAPAPPAIANNASLAAAAPAVAKSADAELNFSLPPAAVLESQNASRAAEVRDRKVETQTANTITTSAAADTVSTEEINETRESGATGRVAGYSAKSLASPLPARVPPPGERWRVEQGILERSENSGQTWSTIDLSTSGLPGLTTASLGQEVWAGDSQGGLSHSSDGGQHWQRVLYGGTENIAGAAIISVAIPSAGHVMIKNSAGHTWITRDNGKTWRLK